MFFTKFFIFFYFISFLLLNINANLARAIFLKLNTLKTFSMLLVFA